MPGGIIDEVGMTTDELKEQFNTSIIETSGYLFLTQRLDDLRYCRWDGQSDDGRKYSKNLGRQVFPWEGASDIKPYTVDDIILDDVDLMQTAVRNAHMQVLVTNTKSFKEAAKNANVLVLNVRRGSVAQLIQIR